MTGASGQCQYHLHSFVRAMVQLTLLFTFAFSPVLAQSAGDWPQFRADSSRTGFNPSETVLSVSTVPGLKQKWSFTADSLIASSPAVVNGVVYVPSGNGTFYALNAATGAVLWKRAITSTSSSPAVQAGVVYVGSGVDTGFFYALGAANGRVLWRVNTGGIPSSPTVVNGTVYVGGGNTNVIALIAANGQQVWNTTVDATVNSSPAVVGGRVYFATQNGTVYSLDAATGHIVWRAIASLNAPVFGAVAVVNGIVYVGGGDGTLYTFNASNGSLSWALTGPGEFPEIRCSPALANGVVYVGYNTGDLLAANAADGHVVWTGTTSLTGIIEASPAVANGVLYVAAEDDNLYAFDAATGKQLKKIALSVFVSSPAVSHGRVFIGGFADHKVHAYM